MLVQLQHGVGGQPLLALSLRGVGGVVVVTVVVFAHVASNNDN